MQVSARYFSFTSPLLPGNLEPPTYIFSTVDEQAPGVYLARLQHSIIIRPMHVHSTVCLSLPSACLSCICPLQPDDPPERHRHRLVHSTSADPPSFLRPRPSTLDTTHSVAFSVSLPSVRQTLLRLYSGPKILISPTHPTQASTPRTAKHVA